MEFKIPEKFNVGGMTVEVDYVERCDGNAVGIAKLCNGKIEIADIYNKDSVQSDSCKLNTFFHELTHCILDTMGENDLSSNEKFVCTFSSFLTEAIVTAK